MKTRWLSEREWLVRSTRNKQFPICSWKYKRISWFILGRVLARHLTLPLSFVHNFENLLLRKKKRRKWDWVSYSFMASFCSKWNFVKICNEDSEIALAPALLIRRYTWTKHRQCSLRPTSDLKRANSNHSGKIHRIRRHIQKATVYSSPLKPIF